MSEFSILNSASAGMEAQRAALDVAARNVAAAEAGDPGSFARLVPRFAFASAPGDGTGDVPPLGFVPPSLEDAEDDDALGAADAGDSSRETLPIRYLGTTVERGVDPDAITEMVAVLDAQRAYEADAAVFDAGKRLAERTIDAGRQ